MCWGGDLSGKMFFKNFFFKALSFVFLDSSTFRELLVIPVFQKPCLHSSQANVLQKVNQPFMNGHLVSLTPSASLIAPGKGLPVSGFLLAK